MLIGKDLHDEKVYLKNTIEKINELLKNYGASSEEQLSIENFFGTIEMSLMKLKLMKTVDK